MNTENVETEVINDAPVKQVTIKQLAEMIEEDYLTTSALVKFSVKLGAIKEVGKEKLPEGTRGKPSMLYEVPNEVLLVFWQDNETDEVPEVPEIVDENVVAEPADDNHQIIEVDAEIVEVTDVTKGVTNTPQEAPIPA